MIKGPDIHPWAWPHPPHPDLPKPSGRPKMPPRRFVLAFFLPSVFRYLFLSIFDWFCIPTCLQKPTKIDQKSIKNRCQEALHLGLYFLIDFWSIFRPPEPQKSLKFYWFYKYFCKIGLSKLTSIFDLILGRLGSHAGRHNGRGHCRCAARLSLLAGSLAALSGYFAFLASKIIKILLVL